MLLTEIKKPARCFVLTILQDAIYYCFSLEWFR